MRVYTSGNISITYPEATTWLYDNLFVKISSLNGVAVGGKVVATEVASGAYRKLEYRSELDNLVFALGDTFLSLWRGGMTFNVVVTPYLNNAAQPHLAFDLQMLEGRTIPGRQHGSTRTVYAYGADDLKKVGFIFPATGSLSTPCGTIPIAYEGFRQLDLSECWQGNGEYMLCYDVGGKGGGGGSSSLDGIVKVVNVDNITPFSGCAVLEWQDTSGDIPTNKSKGGGVWKDEEFDFEDYCIRVIYEEPCYDGFNLFKVRYIDTDGITRYLCGKVLEEETTAKGNDFYKLDTLTPYNKLARKYLVEAAKTVKIGYGELRRDSFWGDIVLSPRIEFLDVNGEWLECALETTKVTVTSDETDDVELTFKIFNY